MRRHEGLALGVPSVAIVNAQHGDETGKESDSLVVLELQGKRCLERSNLKRVSQKCIFGKERLSFTYILPIKTDAEQTQALVVGRTTEKVAENVSLATCGVHCSQARDGNGVEPWEDIGWEELIHEHSAEAVPEPPQGLGVSHVLPVKALQGLDSRQTAPVDSFDVPHANCSDDTTDTVTEQTDGDGAENNGGCAKRQIIEEVLGGKDENTGGGVGSRRSCDGADGMLLDGPWTRVDEFEELDPEGKRAITICSSPRRFALVTTGQDKSPAVSGKVRNQHDEGTRNVDLGRLEGVNLAHDSLESGETCRQEDTAESQGGIKVVTKRQEMLGSVGASDDDGVFSVGVGASVNVVAGRRRSALLIDGVRLVLATWLVAMRMGDLLVDLIMVGHIYGLSLNGVDAPENNSVPSHGG